jgi:AcrR family transcriptional regulator
MKDDDKQQRIKQAVMKLILEEGFAGTSISKIARLAGVSPATVYIYYENKEEMLKDIYTEYSGDIFSYLVRCVDAGMPAGYFIDTLMRNYYSYISEHEEIYSFVDQFSHCPALACQCGIRSGMCELFDLLDERKRRGEICACSDENIVALMFYPVKAIAMEHHVSESHKEERLAEMIRMIQQALLL